MASNSDALSNGLHAHPQPIPASKTRKSRKAPAVKTAVLAKRVQGQSITNIANDLGITRNTTRAIIDESNLDQLMEDGRIQTLNRVPAALKTLDVRLEKNSENAALWLLDKCFDSKQVASKPDPALVLNIQALMGNVTVQSRQPQQVSEQKPIDITPQSDPIITPETTPSK